MTDKPAAKAPTFTLTEDEITTRPTLGRRAFLLGAVGAPAALAACVPTTGGTGITDSDGGAYADPVNNGRGSVGSGWTDSDDGQNSDPANFGRGPSRGYTGLTDADTANSSDAVGYGRG